MLSMKGSKFGQLSRRQDMHANAGSRDDTLYETKDWIMLRLCII